MLTMISPVFWHFLYSTPSNDNNRKGSLFHLLRIFFWECSMVETGCSVRTHYNNFVNKKSRVVSPASRSFWLQTVQVELPAPHTSSLVLYWMASSLTGAWETVHMNRPFVYICSLMNWGGILFGSQKVEGPSFCQEGGWGSRPQESLRKE